MVEPLEELEPDEYHAIERRFAGLPAGTRWAVFRAAWHQYASDRMGWRQYARTGGPSLDDLRALSDAALLQERNMGPPRVRVVRAWLRSQPPVAPGPAPALPDWVAEE